MSLSDKFYEGLSAPLPVVGAQMPVDLVPYAGKPLDPLRAHEAKYKQLEYLQRLSDQASKAALKERLEADMDKVGFVGSNALSRRQYYMDKLAGDGEGKGPSGEPFTPKRDKDPQMSLPRVSLPREPLPPQQPLSPAPDPNLVMSPQSLRNEELGVSLPDPAAEDIRVEQYENQEAERLSRMLETPVDRKDRLDDARQMARYNTRDSGAFIGGLRDFRNQYSTYGVPEGGQPQKPSAQKPRPKAPEEPELGFYDSVRRTLDHYGTRAARGLSTGAQMAASRAYDSNLLGLRDYMDKDQMARINASLYHAYGGNPEDEYAKAYAERYRALRGPQEEGAAPRPDLLNRDQFRDTILEDQMAAYRSRGFNPAMRRDLRNSARQTIDNMYGFEGNRLGTGTIGEDLSLSPFRRALAASGQEAATQPGKSVAKQEAAAAQDATAAEEAAAAQAAEAEQKRLQSLIQAEMNNQSLETVEELKDRTGYNRETDGEFIPFLANYIREQGTTEFMPEDTEGEMQASFRDQRIADTNDIFDKTLSSLRYNPEAARAFLTQVNPRSIQVAQDLATLFDTDPQAALRQVNNMNPAEAQYQMNQLQMIQSALGTDPSLGPIDYSKYQVAEDSESPLSFLPSFGGTDIVNRARQQIGAGGDLDQMEGDARQRAFLYNSMRDVPQGRYYKVEDDVLGNTYFNPVTGDINYEYGTDFGNLNPFRAYNTAEPLPERYHEQYRRLRRRYPGFKG
jgi:hypothetical protein